MGHSGKPQYLDGMKLPHSANHPPPGGGGQRMPAPMLRYEPACVRGYGEPPREWVPRSLTVSATRHVCFRPLAETHNCSIQPKQAFSTSKSRRCVSVWEPMWALLRGGGEMPTRDIGHSPDMRPFSLRSGSPAGWPSPSEGAFRELYGNSSRTATLPAVTYASEAFSQELAPMQCSPQAEGPCVRYTQCSAAETGLWNGREGLTATQLPLHRERRVPRRGVPAESFCGVCHHRHHRRAQLWPAAGRSVGGLHGH